MASNHTTKNDNSYTAFSDVVKWTPTRAKQLNDVGENAAYVKDVSVHGLSGDNIDDTTSAVSPDGFAIFDCVNYATAVNKVTLIAKENYGNTNAGSSPGNDLRFRTCHITGTIYWDSSPVDTQPGRTNDNKHRYVLARNSLGSIDVTANCDRVDVFFFTGSGASAFDDTDTHAHIASIEGYASSSKDLFFYVDESNGTLILYWNGPGGDATPSFMFHVTFGPRFDI